MSRSSTAYTYQIASRLQVEDKIIVFGPLQLTMRQAIILGLAAVLDFQLGHVPLLPALHLFLVASLGVLGAWLAFAQIWGRTPEIWGLILLRYLLLPKRAHLSSSLPSLPAEKERA